MSARRLSVLVVAAGLGTMAVATGAQAPERATFYVLVGSDTILVERVTRTGTELTTELFDLKRTGRTTAAARLDPSGLISAVELVAYKSDRDTVPIQSVSIRFAADSVSFTPSGRPTNTVHVARGVLPNINPSSAFLEQALIRARALGSAGGPISFIYIPNGPEAQVTVTWVGADSAVVQFAGAAMHVAVSPAGRLLGGAVPAQNVRIIRGPATATSAVPGRKTYDAPAGAPYTAQDVVVRTKAGLTLTGTLTLPVSASRGRMPALVTITGSGSQDRDEQSPSMPAYRPFRELADTLGRRGIAVLRLDDRGVNGSDTGPLTVTSADFADDIRAAVGFLRGRSEIDPTRIALAGHSEGGSIGPMVAASDSAIAGLVIMGGAVSPGREILLFQQRFVVDSMAHLVGQQRDAALAQYAHNTDSVAAALPWMKAFLVYDGTPTAARVRAPVLIVHGAKDYQVPVAEAEKTAAAIRSGGNRDVTVQVFPETNHLFVNDAGVGFSYEKLPSYRVRPEVLGAIAEWLVARLRP